MTPAVSIDDVPDPKMRELLCDYMYTTEWRKAEREGASGFRKMTPNITKIETIDTVKILIFICNFSSSYKYLKSI